MRKLHYTKLLLCIYLISNGFYINAQSTTASNSLTGTSSNPNEFLGSSNSFDVIIKSSNQERIRILDDGMLIVRNYGLFTSSSGFPASAAYIRANSNNSTASTPEYTWWNNDQTGIFHPSHDVIGFSTGGVERMKIGADGMMTVRGYGLFTSSSGFPASAAYIRANSNNSTASTPEYTWWNNDQTGIFHPSHDVIGFSTGGVERMKIGADGMMTVRGYGLFTSSSGFPASAAYIRANSNNSTASTPEYTWWNNDQTGIFHPSHDVIGFSTGGVERMKIGADGKLAIGNVTTPGNYSLYVERGILTEKVRVALHSSVDWADYVFAEDYKLMPLPELETFIKKNHHLPNIPSSEEVEKQGIDLAVMDVKLLEKVEELTLYIIELEKQVKELEQKVNILYQGKNE